MGPGRPDSRSAPADSGSEARGWVAGTPSVLVEVEEHRRDSRCRAPSRGRRGTRTWEAPVAADGRAPSPGMERAGGGRPRLAGGAAAIFRLRGKDLDLHVVLQGRSSRTDQQLQPLLRHQAMPGSSCGSRPGTREARAVGAAARSRDTFDDRDAGTRRPVAHFPGQARGKRTRPDRGGREAVPRAPAPVRAFPRRAKFSRSSSVRLSTTSGTRSGFQASTSGKKRLLRAGGGEAAALELPGTPPSDSRARIDGDPA